MSEAIADGTVVQFHYTLTNGEGEVLDSSHERGNPMAYLHGAGNIVPGLERQMVGHVAGDSFKAVVVPSDAYGERVGDGPQPVPKTEFPDDAPLQAGVRFGAVTPDGEQIVLWIVDVQDDVVLVDVNHPLAGVTLTFDVNIVDLREASEEEQTHGQPHGPGGHHH